MENEEQLVETPDSELPGNPAESEHEHAELPDGDNQDAETEEVEEDGEIEVDGRKFVLPKSAAEKIKAQMLMDADYRQKTQATAAERKAVEAERAEVAKARETQQHFVKEVARVEALNDQLALYEKVDWDGLRQADVDEYLKHQEHRRQLEVERGKAVEAVTQKQQQFALDEQQAFAKQIQQAEAYVQREIPGWNAERSDQLKDFAESQGVKMDPAMARLLIANPALLKVFHQAEKYSQLEKKQSAKPAAAPPPKPATRVTAARPGAQRDPSKLSTAEWMEHRNKQLTKR